jgi:hypothetical protein
MIGSDICLDPLQTAYAGTVTSIAASPLPILEACPVDHVNQMTVKRAR